MPYDEYLPLTLMGKIKGVVYSSPGIFRSESLRKASIHIVIFGTKHLLEAPVT